MDRAGFGLVLLCFCVGVPRALGQFYVNVATGKTYKQKSTYSSQGASSNAANGDTGGEYSASNCIHTQVYGTSSNIYYDTNPWWEVDLGRSYPVYSIKVWARSGFKRRLYTFTITVDGQQCATVTYRSSRSVSVTCSSGVMYGQVVRLTRTGSDQPLNLCEFQIFVPSGVSQCYAGYYGTQCNLRCSNNCGGGPGSNFCYKNTGSCYDGCQAGWYGDTCNTACRSNNCLNYECNQQTGACTACKPGYRGNKCQLACSSLSPGCAQCTQYGQTCTRCKAGFASPSCTECQDGYYKQGDQCVQCSNNCAVNTNCNKNTGKCDGCRHGYYGDQCQNACSDLLSQRCVQCSQDGQTCTACSNDFAAPSCTACQDGYYKQGDQCVQCSNNCAVNTNCNKDTGKCDGCMYGYYGDRCQHACSGLGQGCVQCSQDGQTCTQCRNGFAAPSCAECQDGYYKQGARCFQCSYYCAPNTNCNKDTGKCDGCVDGRHGDKCNLYCTPSGRCLRCDQDTGVCLACSPSSSNLAPPSCTDCLDGFYDPYSYPTSCTNCTWRCYNDTACDKRTGNCDRCPPGKRGDRCGQLCFSGSYGQDCSESCGHCRYNSACDVVSGACSGCDAGFQPPLCKTGCENGTYGEDCGQTCGHCKDGTACDKVNGQCPLCDPGWSPPMCKTPCTDGYYGVNCTQPCGTCLNGAVCSKTDGHCSSCPTGKQPPLCDTICTEGFYGQNCSRKCGRCSGGLPCVHDNGVCQYGCETGYEGALCQTAKSEESDGGLQSLVGPVVGSIFGVGLLLTISLTAAICWRRRSQENLVRTNNPPIALSDKKICTPDPPTSDSTAPVPANSANESVYVEVEDTENTYDKLHPYSNQDAERQQYSQFAPSGRDVDTPTADSAYVNTSLPMGKEDEKI